MYGTQQKRVRIDGSRSSRTSRVNFVSAQTQTCFSRKTEHVSIFCHAASACRNTTDNLIRRQNIRKKNKSGMHTRQIKPLTTALYSSVRLRRVSSNLILSANCCSFLARETTYKNYDNNRQCVHTVTDTRVILLFIFATPRLPSR